MALDDIVQNVTVKVKVEDDDAQKLDALQKKIEGLSGAADSARTGGGGGKGGIEGLSDAFDNLGRTGAESFSNILSQTTHGELSGLATLLGGPVAGSVTKVAEQLLEFSRSQDAATLKNMAMAKQFGTTPDVMEGYSAAMGEAGVSTTGFERLVNRMSQRVSQDYSGMMRNIRTDSTSAAEASLHLKDAQEDLQTSFEKTGQTAMEASLNTQKAREHYLQSVGVPKEAFALDDQMRARQEAALELDKAITAEHDADYKQRNSFAEKQIALDKAQEAAREQELKSIPRVTDALRQGMQARQQMSLVGETDTQTLMRSVENLARGGKEGPATGQQVFQTLTEAARSGAIGEDRFVNLMKTEMGQRAASAGGAGNDAERLYGASRSGMFTPDAIKARTETYRGMGLLPQEGDKSGEQQVIRSQTEVSKFNQEIGLAGRRLNEGILSPIVETMARGGSRILEAGANTFQGIRGVMSGQGGQTESHWTEGAPSWWMGAPATPTPDVLDKINKGEATTPEGGAPGITLGSAFAGTAQIVEAGGAALAQAFAAAASAIGQGGVNISPGGGLSPSGGTDAQRYGGAAWGGGAIRIPGFARGGRVRRFGDGGMLEDFGVGRTPVMQIGVGPSLIGAPGGVGMGGGSIAGSEGARFYAANVAPLPDLVNQGGGMGYWDGGMIPGFADGGNFQGQMQFVEARGKQMDFDEQIKEVQEEMDNYTSHHSSREKGYDEKVTSYRNKLEQLQRKKDMAAGLDSAKLGIGAAMRQQALLDRRDQLNAGEEDRKRRLSDEIYQTENPGMRIFHTGPSFSTQDQLDKSRRDLSNSGLWTGGMIPGFADGGDFQGQMQFVEARGKQMDFDEQIKEVQEEMDNFTSHHKPSEKGYDEKLTSYRNKLNQLQRKKDMAAGLDSAKLGLGAAMRQQALLDRRDQLSAGEEDRKRRLSDEIYQTENPGVRIFHTGPSFSTQDQLDKSRRDLSNSGLWTGGIPGFAMGSIKGPGTGTSDSILARLSNGEFVMKAASVRAYGEGFMHAINNMSLPPPKYAMGGMVPTPAIPHFAEGGMGKADTNLHLHIGDEVFGPMKAPEHVASQLRKYAVGQQTGATSKRAPSWVGG